jgi:hypothetical protein
MVSTVLLVLLLFGLTVVVLVAMGIGFDREVRWWSRRSGSDDGDRAGDHRDAPGVGPPGEGPPA